MRDESRPAVTENGGTIGGGNAPYRLSAAERQRQALELRKAGKSFDVIAAELGYAGHQGAHKAVVTALRRTLQEPADDVRKLELERLDALITGIWDDAAGGDVQKLDRVLKIMERRAKLLGLDAPAQIDLEVRIREAALRDGIDPDEAVRAATELIREHRSRA